jgi:hypothetical protein
MQMSWVKAAEEIPITPLTPPENVVTFIQAHPGLCETCEAFPDLLIEYAPQLTIPGFGGDLEESIEEAYKKSCEAAEKRRAENSTFGSGLTTNGKSPLCDEEWALRHPSFGDYEPATVANAYFSGGMFGPTVSPYEHSDHAFWLLSDASIWLPRKIRSCLIEGMASWGVWTWYEMGDRKKDLWETNGLLFSALREAVEGKPFHWRSRIKDDLFNKIQLAIESLNLPNSAEEILERFRTYRFAQKYIREQQRLRKKQASKAGAQTTRRLSRVHHAITCAQSTPGLSKTEIHSKP